MHVYIDLLASNKAEILHRAIQSPVLSILLCS